MAAAVNFFDDLIPKDVPKKAAMPAGENPFADLIPQQQGEQHSNVAAKGRMRPGDKVPTDVTGQMAQNVTMNYGDELVAGMRAPVDAAVNYFTGEGPTNLGESYDQVRAFQSAQDAATKEQHPIASAAAGFAGALVPVGGTLKLLQGGGLIARTAKGAAGGAALGATAGFGEGNTLEERGQNAIEGAKWGAGTGVALPIIAKGASTAYRAGRAVTRSATTPFRAAGNPETFAAGKVAEAFKRDQMDPNRVAGRLASNQGAKADLVAADVAGKNTGNLLRSAANVPSDAREKLTRDLFKRQDKQLDRLSADVATAFGNPKDFHSTVEGLAKGRKAAAQPLFDKAFNTGTPYTKPLENVLNRPLTKQLVSHAETAAANRGEKFRQLFQDRQGNVRRVVDTEGLHRVKMEIDNAINALKRSQETGLKNANIRDLTILKKDLLGAMDNPEYKAALKQYAGDSAMVNAIDDGFENGLKMEPEMIKKALDGMTPSEADLWRMGFARSIVNKLRDTGRAGTNRAEILYSPKYMDRMNVAFRGNNSGREFMRNLMLERRMARTKQAVEGNSSTAQQLAEGAEAGVESQQVRDNLNFAGSVAKLDPIGALLNVLGRARNTMTGMRPEVADEIIKMLTSRDPAVVKRAQGLVQKELDKISRRAGRPQAVENLVTGAGLASVVSQ